MNYHDPTLTRNWDNLKKHHKKIKDRKLKDFFKDQNRFNDLSWSANGLTVDLSKNFINLDTFGILYDFAKEVDLESTRGEVRSLGMKAGLSYYDRVMLDNVIGFSSIEVEEAMVPRADIVSIPEKSSLK